jgi:hypothetical protein
VILKNGKPALEGSKPTPRPSARRRHQALAKPTVASSLFKSRVLNPLHLNQVFKENKTSNDKEEDNGFHEEENQYTVLKMEKSAEKHRMKNGKYEPQYGFYPHGPSSHPYRHKRGSEPQSKSIPKTIRSPHVDSSSSLDVKSNFIKNKLQVSNEPR